MNITVRHIDQFAIIITPMFCPESRTRIVVAKGNKFFDMEAVSISNDNNKTPYENCLSCLEEFKSVRGLKWKHAEARRCGDGYVFTESEKPADVRLQIQKDRSSGEYRVAVFYNGKFHDDPTYYTDWLDDAKGTCENMAERYQNNGHKVITPKKIVYRDVFDEDE